MVLYVQHSYEGTNAFQLRAILKPKINALFRPTRSRSLYAILSASQGKAYLLHGL
jgi:hypothetical protein